MVVFSSKKSTDTLNDGFSIDIVKTNEELFLERCRVLNQHFFNKQFAPETINELGMMAVCRGYRDKITICLDERRAAIIFDEGLKNLSDFTGALGGKGGFSKQNLRYSKYNWRVNGKILMLYNKELTYKEMDELKHDDPPIKWQQRIDEVIQLLS